MAVDSTIRTIGEALVTRLAPVSALGINVALLPNKRNQQAIAWDTTTYPNGNISIIWYEHDFQAVNTLSRQGQPANAKWMMEAKFRNLKDATGVWKLTQSVCDLTIGFRPTGGSGAIVAESAKLQEPKNELWMWTYEFYTPIWFEGTGNADIGEVGANLTGIFFEASEVRDQYGGVSGPVDFPSPE